MLWKHYVTAPTGVGAVYVRRSDGTSDTYYVTTDHLGSTDKLLKAATGTVQVAESFAPFGARRGSAWQGAPSAADLTAISNSTPDGFTGHEMLDGVGLIHMTGAGVRSDRGEISFKSIRLCVTPMPVRAGTAMGTSKGARSAGPIRVGGKPHLRRSRIPCRARPG